MPLSIDELRRLYADLEADRVERKESLSDGERIRQAICAFANDLPNHRMPGIIFIGQKNDGSCANLPITDDLLLRLSGYRSDGRLLPFPVMHVTKQTIDGCELVLVVVEPSDNPPVKLDGRAWIRVGPRRALATVEEERRLVEKRRWGTLTFDAHGAVGTVLNDIDIRMFEEEYLPAAVAPEILSENGRSLNEKLMALRLMKPEGIPTIAAILLLGKNPRAWVPGAYVQFLRIDGVNLTDTVRNQRSVDGPIGGQIRALDEIVSLNIEQRATIGGITREDAWDYPTIALRQLIRNALLHRNYEGTNAPTRITWYSDRIEILNPGGPYGQVTKENFGRPGVTDYRNPTLAEALKNMKYVEQFGVGIAIARDSLAKNRNPPPEFMVEDQHVHVTVRRAQ